MWTGYVRRMRPGKLNTLSVKRARAPGRYADGGNLYLFVRPSGARTWTFRFKLPGGKAREMSLGVEPDVTLAEAREKARDARRLLEAGKDPLDDRANTKREAAGQDTTFKEAAARYIRAHEDSWRNAKHRAQWSSTLATYADPTLGALPVGKVATGNVVAVLEPIWRLTPETASRLRGRIEAVLDYATALGWRAGENPARWKGHLANLLPKRSKLDAVQHHAAMPWGECPAFMRELAGQGGTAALALRFAILTAARTSEVIDATWGEISLDRRIWTVPASRMKAAKEHRVPLSKSALAVLEVLHTPDVKPGNPIFPGSTHGRPRKITQAVTKAAHSVATARGLSNMAMAALMRRMKRGDLTVHGFRSSFRDWAAETNPAPREVAEEALAHTLKDKVEAAYRRGDLLERRTKLMEDWAAFLSRPAGAGSVIPIGERSRVMRQGMGLLRSRAAARRRQLNE